MRPGSSIALGRVAATLALAPGSRGDRARAALWPPTLAAGLSQAAGARTLCGSEGTGRRRGGRSGGAIPGAGLGCLLRVQPVEWQRSRRGSGWGEAALCTRPPQQAWEGGQRGRGQAQDSVTYPKVNPISPFRIPHAVQKRRARGGSASQWQRTKASCTETQPAPAPDAARCPRPGPRVSVRAAERLLPSGFSGPHWRPA